MPIKSLLLPLLFAPMLLMAQFLHAASPIPDGARAAAARQEKQQKRAGPEQAIKHVLLSQVDAWNHGRLEDYMQGYWRSPDLTFFSGGTVTKGWEPTLERYRKRYQGEGREMGRLDFQDLKIDVLGRRAAVVTGKWHLTTSDGKNPHGLFTLIFKRMPEGWRIMHDHTSAE